MIEKAILNAQSTLNKKKYIMLPILIALLLSLPLGGLDGSLELNCLKQPSLCQPLSEISQDKEFLDAVYYGLNRASNKEEVEEEVGPHLVPAKHFTRIALDHIFSKKGVLASIESMKAAGFEILIYRQGRGLIVASHPLLKNFLIKTYLDTVSHVEWTRWVRRVKGRMLMQNFLDENPIYKRYFKVPLKWIYPIPTQSLGTATETTVPREYILVVENMYLVDKKTNAEMYKKLITHTTLDGLYLIIDQTGFSDGHIGNLPFSSDGKIAFIDTEYTNTWPVHFDWMTKWFSPKQKRYWEALIKNKGPKK